MCTRFVRPGMGAALQPPFGLDSKDVSEPYYCGPGQRATEMAVADFILVHRRGLVARLIRFGQRLRFPKEAAYWNHAAIYDGKNCLIEAKGGHHARRVSLASYDGVDYLVVPINCGDEAMRENAQSFARSQLGAPYGYLTIVALVGWIFTGGKLTIGLSGSDICSGLVARALERTGAIFTRDPECVMPADLAVHYGVRVSGWGS